MINNCVVREILPSTNNAIFPWKWLQEFYHVFKKSWRHMVHDLTPWTKLKIFTAYGSSEHFDGNNRIFHKLNEINWFKRFHSGESLQINNTKPNSSFLGMFSLPVLCVLVMETALVIISFIFQVRNIRQCITYCCENKERGNVCRCTGWVQSTRPTLCFDFLRHNLSEDVMLWLFLVYSKAKATVKATRSMLVSLGS